MREIDDIDRLNRYEIYNERNKIYEHDPRSSDKIDTKNEMLVYLKIIEDRLIDMFSTHSIIRKINNVNYKEYVHDKLKKKLNSGDTHRAEAILLAQIKAGNNSNKLKNEIRQIVYLLNQRNNITKKFKTMLSSHYNNESVD